MSENIVSMSAEAKTAYEYTEDYVAGIDAARDVEQYHGILDALIDAQEYERAAATRSGYVAAQQFLKEGIK